MENKTTKTIPPVEETSRLVLKLLGGIASLFIGAILTVFSPPFAVLAIWGIIWILQVLAGFVKKFKKSKIYPKIKGMVKKVLVVLLICSIIVTLFNFIAGLSATTIIIILLILILLK